MREKGFRSHDLIRCSGRTLSLMTTKWWKWIYKLHEDEGLGG